MSARRTNEEELLNLSSDALSGGMHKPSDVNEITAEDANDLENEFFGKDDHRAPVNKGSELRIESEEQVGLRNT
jgi:hypothetical protein